MDKALILELLGAAVLAFTLCFWTNGNLDRTIQRFSSLIFVFVAGAIVSFLAESWLYVMFGSAVLAGAAVAWAVQDIRQDPHKNCGCRPKD